MAGPLDAAAHQEVCPKSGLTETHRKITMESKSEEKNKWCQEGHHRHKSHTNNWGGAGTTSYSAGKLSLRSPVSHFVIINDIDSSAKGLTNATEQTQSWINIDPNQQSLQTNKGSPRWAWDAIKMVNTNWKDKGRQLKWFAWKEVREEMGRKVGCRALAWRRDFNGGEVWIELGGKEKQHAKLWTSFLS